MVSKPPRWSPVGVTGVIEPPCLEKEGFGPSQESFLRISSAQRLRFGATSADGDARESQQVRHGEFAILACAKLAGPGMPGRRHAQIRTRVGAQQTDEDFGHDASTRRSESVSGAEHFRLLEDVEEERSAPPEDLDQVFRERLHVLRMQDEVVRDSNRPRDRLAGGEAEGLAPLQISLRQCVDFLRDSLRQDAHAETEFRVDLATRLNLQFAFVELEEPRPLDHVAVREFAESTEVLFRRLCEDWDVLHFVIQLVLSADHTVPEPVCGHREFDGHERTLRPVEEPRENREGLDCLRAVACGDLERHGMEDVFDYLGPYKPREEVVDHGPLVVPSNDPAALVEPSLGRDALQGGGLTRLLWYFNTPRPSRGTVRVSSFRESPPGAEPFTFRPRPSSPALLRPARKPTPPSSL